MIPYFDLKTQIQNLIQDDSTETAADILRYANTVYRQIASTHFFRPLIKSHTIATSILPGDVERLFYVQWSDTDYLVFPISQQDRYLSPVQYNWFSQMTTASTLVTGSDGVTVANATSFTSAAPSTDFDATSTTLVGEYIRIGTNGGIYKISSVTDANTLVLTEGFRGAAGTAQSYQIRPEGTQQITFTDYDGTAVTNTTSTLYYQRVPLPLYNDYDQILLPGDCQAVIIKVHQMLLLENKYDNDALKRQPEFEFALAKMESMEAPVSRSPVPRDRNMNEIGYGRRKTTERFDQNDRRVL